MSLKKISYRSFFQKNYASAWNMVISSVCMKQKNTTWRNLKSIMFLYTSRHKTWLILLGPVSPTNFSPKLYLLCMLKKFTDYKISLGQKVWKTTTFWVFITLFIKFQTMHIS